MEMNLTLDHAINLVGQLATWATVLLVLRTLREMERQRKSTYKPDVVVKSQIFEANCERLGNLWLPTEWSTDEQGGFGILTEMKLETGFHIKLMNIGFGTAKDIRIKWDFDVSETIYRITNIAERI